MKSLFILNDPPYGTERSMDARGIKDPELLEGTRRSSLEELADWTQWADTVLVF